MLSLVTLCFYTSKHAGAASNKNGSVSDNQKSVCMPWVSVFVFCFFKGYSWESDALHILERYFQEIVGI